MEQKKKENIPKQFFHCHLWWRGLFLLIQVELQSKRDEWHVSIRSAEIGDWWRWIDDHIWGELHHQKLSMSLLQWDQWWLVVHFFSWFVSIDFMDTMNINIYIVLKSFCYISKEKKNIQLLPRAGTLRSSWNHNHVNHLSKYLGVYWLRKNKVLHWPLFWFKSILAAKRGVSAKK